MVLVSKEHRRQRARLGFFHRRMVHSYSMGDFLGFAKYHHKLSVWIDLGRGKWC